eukprot:11712608-Ditylum_brightwellii.AAC.1
MHDDKDRNGMKENPNNSASISSGSSFRKVAWSSDVQKTPDQRQGTASILRRDHNHSSGLPSYITNDISATTSTFVSNVTSAGSARSYRWSDTSRMSADSLGVAIPASNGDVNNSGGRGSLDAAIVGNKHRNSNE